MQLNSNIGLIRVPSLQKSCKIGVCVARSNLAKLSQDKQVSSYAGDCLQISNRHTLTDRQDVLKIPYFCKKSSESKAYCRAKEEPVVSARWPQKAKRAQAHLGGEVVFKKMVEIGSKLMALS